MRGDGTPREAETDGWVYRSGTCSWPRFRAALVGEGGETASSERSRSGRRSERSVFGRLGVVGFGS